MIVSEKDRAPGESHRITRAFLLIADTNLQRIPSLKTDFFFLPVIKADVHSVFSVHERAGNYGTIQNAC